MIADRIPYGVSRMPFTLRPVFLTGLFIVCLLWAVPLAAQTATTQTNGFPADGTPIVGVEIEGTVRTTTGAIERAMTLQPGTPFTAEAYRRDLQSIADLGVYDPLEIAIETQQRDDGLHLLVRVKENPTIRNITFIGNVAFKAERLRREIDVKEGELLPVAAASRTRRSLQAFYSQGGFSATRINVEVDPVEAETPTVDMRILIDEGEKIRIKRLDLEGNKHFPSWWIRFWVQNNSGFLFFRNWYDDRAFDDDLRLIEDKYRDAGFLDATATRGTFEYNEEKAWVAPSIIINEGPRYTVTGVAFDGITLFTPEEINSAFVRVVGRTYNGNRFREALERVRRLYGDQGYINTRIDGRFEKNPAAGTVLLRLMIEESDVSYVGAVRVQKSEYDYEFDLTTLERFMDWMSPGVKTEVIEREVQLKPGEKYRTVDEVRTVDRLRGLGFFENVRVRREPTADPQVTDAVVEVEEDPNAGYFGISAGVGEVTGFTVGFNYTNPNLFGEAKVLRANLLLGSRVQSFTLGYLDRYWRDTDDSLGLNAYYDNFDYRAYLQRTLGASAEIGRPINDNSRAFVRLRLENVDLKREDEDLVEDMDDYGVVGLRFLLARDTVDSRRWQTRGYRVTGGIEPGYARDWMLKLTHDLSAYRALDKREDWVYAYEHGVGIAPYDADHVGIGERFFLGGTSTLRGFEARGVGPKDPGVDDIAIGGSLSLRQRHELRHRFNRVIRGRLFVDAGILGFKPTDLEKPRIGTGTGVSFDLGAFSIDVDLAYAALKHDHDRTRVLHFRIRSNF